MADGTHDCARRLEAKWQCNAHHPEDMMAVLKKINEFEKVG
jgi:hypothetical protein